MIKTVYCYSRVSTTRNLHAITQKEVNIQNILLLCRSRSKWSNNLTATSKCKLHTNVNRASASTWRSTSSLSNCLQTPFTQHPHGRPLQPQQILPPFSHADETKPNLVSKYSSTIRYARSSFQNAFQPQIGNHKFAIEHNTLIALNTRITATHPHGCKTSRIRSTTFSEERETLHIPKSTC